jgi:hypothetical protein
VEFKSPEEYRAEARRHREMAMLTSRDEFWKVVLDLAAAYDELARHLEELRRREESGKASG